MKEQAIAMLGDDSNFTLDKSSVWLHVTCLTNLGAIAWLT